MKKLLKKYRKSIIVFIFVGIIFIPLCIHILFKIPAPCDFFTSCWSAGDILSFYGVLIGSVVTVWGVYLSIQYSKQSYKDDVRNRVLPFVALTTLRTKSRWNFFKHTESSSNTDVDNEYSEYVLEKVYFIIENGKISIKTDLTDEQWKKVHQGGQIWQNCGSSIALIDINLLSAPFELENVGNGVANLLRIGLNKESQDESKYQYLTPFPLKVGQKLYIHIYCENEDNSNVGNYIFDVYYEDIYKNEYRQRYMLVITEPNNTIHSYMLLDGKQEHIKEM